MGPAAQSNPGITSQNFVNLNKEAVRLLKAGDAESAAAQFTKILDNVSYHRVHLPDLHVCLGNRSAAWLALKKPKAALQDAIMALRHIEGSAAGVPLRRCAGYANCMRRMGDALLASSKPFLAQDAYEEGLQADCHHLGCRKGLQAAQTVQHNLQGVQHQQQAALLTERSSFLPHRGLESSDCQTSRPTSLAEHTSRAANHEVGGSVRDITRLDGGVMTPSTLALLAKTLPDMPMVSQITPKKGEVDVTTRDTLNYLTIQSDVAVPAHLLNNYLEDGARMVALETAICAAVSHISLTQNRDCRVLVLGSGLGVVPLLALKAGAVHVTVVERWMYAALACKELLLRHDADPDTWQVINSRVTDVQLVKDMPVCANLIIAEPLLDDGLLTSGFSPCLRHALEHLSTPDAIVLPQQIDVWCQAVNVTMPSPCGLSLSALHDYTGSQGCLGPGSGVPAGMAGRVCPMSHPQLAFSWNCNHLPDKPEARYIPIASTMDGRVNGMLTWYTVHLYANISWSSSTPDTAPTDKAACDSKPHCGTTVKAGLHALTQLSAVHHDADACGHEPVSHDTAHVPAHAALQGQVYFVKQQLRVATGTRLTVVAAHNTARLGFSLLAAGDHATHTARAVSSCNAGSVPLGPPNVDVSIPQTVFAFARNEKILVAYQQVIQQAVQQIQQSVPGQEVHALVLNDRAGLLACIAALAGATSVTCIEPHPTLALIARRLAADNAVCEKVCVLHGTLSDVMKGVHVPKAGCNLLIANVDNPTLFGGGVINMISSAVSKGLVASDAVLVPSKAQLYCQGLERIARRPAGSHLEAGSVPQQEERLLSSADPHLDGAGSLLHQIDIAVLNRYRFTDEPVLSKMDKLPHKQLTNRMALWEVDMAALLAGQQDAVRIVTDQEVTENHTSDLTASQTASSCVRADHNSKVDGDNGTTDHDLHGDTPKDAAQQFVKQGKGGGLMIQAIAQRTGVLNAVAISCGLQFQQDAVQQLVMASPYHVLVFTPHVMAVRTGQPVQLVAQRQGSSVVLDVRPSKGSPAPKPPWMEEWGGGVSIENPHVQRLKYCELLESDLMQRLPQGRGPSAEQDVAALASQCGSLQLHPPAVKRSLHHLALLERLYRPGSTETADYIEPVTGIVRPDAATRWEMAALAADETRGDKLVTEDGMQEECDKAGQQRDAGDDEGIRVVFPPEVVPEVHWKQVQGFEVATL